jgi:hypothetical protein
MKVLMDWRTWDSVVAGALLVARRSPAGDRLAILFQ